MIYGLPYCGSKNAIAKKIVDTLPPAETFVDLFCGGCAVTHAAMLSGKYKHFIINDRNPLIVQMFTDAIAGKYRDEKRWISRDDFKNLYKIDPIVAYCWSFGYSPNKGYLYGANIEPIKKALHYSRVYGDDSLIAELGLDLNKLGKSLAELQHLESLSRLQHLESLSRVQHLESLSRVQHLESLSRDYRKVTIPTDAVVYCDIPYRGTHDGYDGEADFDYDTFYDWARHHKCYISEYRMPDDFKCVAEFERRGHLSATNNTHNVTERIYTTEER